MGSDRLAAVAYVPGVGKSDPIDPPTNLMGDPYDTDGYRLVAVLADDDVERETFEWLGHDAPAAASELSTTPP